MSIEVVANHPAAEGIRRVVLARPDGWSHRPGQVAELTLAPGPAGYFAIASGPDEATLDFLVKHGPDTTQLTSAEPGAMVELRGPFGAGFDLPDAAAGRRLVFVGAGTALSALRSGVLAALGAHPPGALSIVLGARRLAELGFRDELARWADAGVHVRTVMSRPDPDDAWRGWDGRTGYVQGHLADLAGLAEPATSGDTWAFLAGSDALEDAVVAALRDVGVPAGRIQRNYRPDDRAPVS